MRDPVPVEVVDLSVPGTLILSFSLPFNPSPYLMRVTFRLIIVFVSLLGLIGGKFGAAQEFNCAMNINDEQLEGTSYD